MKRKVENAQVTHSSGNEKLDDAAVACVRTWRYEKVFEDDNPVHVVGHAKVSWKDAQ